MRRLITYFCLLLFIVYISIDIDYGIYENNEISVEVKGEVIKDEIIKSDKYSTIEDILELVELTDNADLSSISLQEKLYNNQIIVIPSKCENKLISINSASISDLCNLPGIGENIANKIVAYRQEYGCFNSIEEIMNVGGIGKKKYETIKEYICL